MGANVPALPSLTSGKVLLHGILVGVGKMRNCTSKPLRPHVGIKLGPGPHGEARTSARMIRGHAYPPVS